MVLIFDFHRKINDIPKIFLSIIQEVFREIKYGICFDICTFTYRVGRHGKIVVERRRDSEKIGKPCSKLFIDVNPRNSNKIFIIILF